VDGKSQGSPLAAGWQKMEHLQNIKDSRQHMKHLNVDVANRLWEKGRVATILLTHQHATTTPKQLNASGKPQHPHQLQQTRG